MRLRVFFFAVTSRETSNDVLSAMLYLTCRLRNGSKHAEVYRLMGERNNGVFSEYRDISSIYYCDKYVI